MTDTRPVRVGYLGPPGTFSEEALLTQPDYAGAEPVPFGTLADVLDATEAGGVDLGFVPIENSIEGSVLVTLDSLVFEHRLLIQREVVLPVHLAVVGRAGADLGAVTTVYAFPFAAGQCRAFLASHMSGAEVVPAGSNADAVRRAAEAGDPSVAALGSARAGALYGLDVLAPEVEDHPDNSTRFVALARAGVPAPTGHDRTSIACFQHADRPGSLHAILGQFSARDINLTKLESRPTKKGLGQYCFIIDLEGHVDDEIVADCLRDLHVQLADIRFLGSYPAAGESAPARRRDASEAWRAADRWLEELRAQVRPPA